MSIKLSNIYHTYSKGTPFERLALNDVSLEISKGEIVAIIGHTGYLSTAFKRLAEAG